MILLKQFEGYFDIFKNGAFIGKVSLSENDFHNQNIYLKFDFVLSDEGDCRELFSKIYAAVKRPLQAMLYSNDEETAKMLSLGGFELKRKCYETEAEKADYLGNIINSEPLFTQRGEEKYKKFAKLLYDNYIEQHKDINPFSAGYSSFCEKLPESVYYDESENFAFIEENEIAYIYASDTASFKNFAESAVSLIFEKYETVCFESDDNDFTAMLLKSLFKENGEPSYDTYVYNGIDD